jgi:hypothetical protein
MKLLIAACLIASAFAAVAPATHFYSVDYGKVNLYDRLAPMSASYMSNGAYQSWQAFPVGQDDNGKSTTHGKLWAQGSESVEAGGYQKYLGCYGDGPNTDIMVQELFVELMGYVGGDPEIVNAQAAWSAALTNPPWQLLCVSTLGNLKLFVNENIPAVQVDEFFTVWQVSGSKQAIIAGLEYHSGLQWVSANTAGSDYLHCADVSGASFPWGCFWPSNAKWANMYGGHAVDGQPKSLSINGGTNAPQIGKRVFEADVDAVERDLDSSDGDGSTQCQVRRWYECDDEGDARIAKLNIIVAGYQMPNGVVQPLLCPGKFYEVTIGGGGGIAGFGGRGVLSTGGRCSAGK